MHAGTGWFSARLVVREMLPESKRARSCGLCGCRPYGTGFRARHTSYVSPTRILAGSRRVLTNWLVGISAYRNP